MFLDYSVINKVWHTCSTKCFTITAVAQYRQTLIINIEIVVIPFFLSIRSVAFSMFLTNDVHHAIILGNFYISNKVCNDIEIAPIFDYRLTI